MAKKATNHASNVEEITTKTATISVEALGALTRSPYQPRDCDDEGKVALAQDIASRGLDNAIIVGICGDGVRCIVQGHRRKSAIIWGRSVGLSVPTEIKIQVREYQSRNDDALRDDTMDHGQSVGIANKWELYRAVVPFLKDGESTYGAIVYRLKEAFDHNFGRIPEKEAKIRSLERMAEVMANDGDMGASRQCLKEAIAEQAAYRRGAMQTYASVYKLAYEHGRKDVEEYMRKVWLGELDKGQPILSQGPLVKLASTMVKEGDWAFEALWAEKTAPREDAPKVKPISVRKLKDIRDSRGSKIVISIIDAIANGRVTVDDRRVTLNQ